MVIMMLFVISFSVQVIFDKSTASSICGNPNDACMENYSDCEKLFDEGCAKIATLESCPYQYLGQKNLSLRLSLKREILHIQ